MERTGRGANWRWRVRLGVVSLGILAFLALAGCASTPRGWQAVGPGGEDVTVLAADPQVRGILYAGTASGNTYLARGDLTGTFAPSNTSPDGGRVTAILADPHQTGVVYAATFGGLYASDDYGQRWRARGTGLPGGDNGANLSALAYGPVAGMLFAGTGGRGIYITRDSGDTWRPVGGRGLPPNAGVNVLLWNSPASTLYAAISSAGVYVSTDNGDTWTARNDGLPPQEDVAALTVLPKGGLGGDASTLYAAGQDGIFALPANATTWQRLGGGLPGDGVRAVYALDTSGTLYAGAGSAVFFSTDGGRSWRRIAAPLNAPVNDVIAVVGKGGGNVVYAASGTILRYPANQGASTDSVLPALISGLVLLGLVYYLLVRIRVVPSPRAVLRRRGQAGDESGESDESKERDER